MSIFDFLIPSLCRDTLGFVKISLVVVTSAKELGGQFKTLLAGTSFDSTATADFAEAIKIVRQTAAPAVFLDVELEESGISILDVGYALRQINPALKVIILTHNGEIPDLGSLAPLAIVRKPVSASDIKNVLARLGSTPVAGMKTQVKAEEANFTGNETIPWLRDVSKAAQQLTRLTLESSAQAALITRQNELWAYAGQLSREAAQELGQSIQRYWDQQTQSDLLRFIRLTSTDAQHMLYATRLSSQMILALVFDAETPFSTIRTQAGKLAHTLTAAPQENEKPVDAVSSVMALRPSAAEELIEEEETSFPPISELLGDVPPPVPAISKLPISAPKNSPVSRGFRATPSMPFSRESSPAMRLSDKPEVETPKRQEAKPAPKIEAESETDLNATRKHIPDDLAETRVSQNLIETRPQSLTEVAHRIVLEPVSPALYNLTYACLLVPRMENHFLTGDVNDRISEWVPQICVAFGWRLEHLAIRPEYLQWIVNVPPSTSPGYLMRVMRQQISDRLFAEFVRFKKDNPSGDFWAPGYLIMGGSTPHPPKLVKDFIKQTRSRQGVGGDSQE